MAESMAMQWQGLVSMSIVHITKREHGASMVRAAARDHVEVQGLCITGPAPHCLRASGELVPSLTGSSTQESGTCTSPKQHLRAGPGGRDVDEPTPWA